MPTTKKRKKPITARNACDRIFSELIRSRGRCQSCGTTRNLQCSHIISRRYAWTRTMSQNALALCAGCHFNWHHDPVFAHGLIEKTIGLAMYEDLRKVAQENTGQRFDWFAERERLTTLHKELAA
jgi:hypothetical protein